MKKDHSQSFPYLLQEFSPCPVKKPFKALWRLWSAWFLGINRQVLWTRVSAFNDEIDTMPALCCELILAGKQGENYHIINQLSPPATSNLQWSPREVSNIHWFGSIALTTTGCKIHSYFLTMYTHYVYTSTH